MVSMSFSCTLDRMKAIYEFNQLQSDASSEKDIPISATIGLLIQRGLAYSLLLAEKKEEINSPGVTNPTARIKKKKW